MRRFISISRIAGFASFDSKVPDHSTFSKNRHGRFRESNVLRHLFETVVARCMAEGLVGADGFAVDASLIAADANKQRSVPSDEWNLEEIKDRACRAAHEYLATLDDAAFGAASPVTPKFISSASGAVDRMLSVWKPMMRSGSSSVASISWALSCDRSGIEGIGRLWPHTLFSVRKDYIRLPRPNFKSSNVRCESLNERSKEALCRVWTFGAFATN